MEINRVLIVDDEEHIRLVSSLSARKVGKWEVAVAASGEEGIRAAIRERPDVMLLDVMMPDLDGPGTFQRLQEDERTAGIPVIFLTAKVQTHEIEAYLALGAAGVIRKPFDPMTLPDEIRKILNGS
ncbi:MAG: response regulator [Myxococcales bacterium]|nr:response regulator [Myxococcales bacterium]